MDRAVGRAIPGQMSPSTMTPIAKTKGELGLKPVNLSCCKLWHFPWVLALLLSSLVGCGGCWTSNEEKLTREELEKKRREQQESLQLSELVSVPADTEVKLLTAKPGHWIETQQQFKSNREDLQVVAVENIARGKEPAKIPGTNFVNEFSRRLALPKGQTKSVKMQCFVPFGARQQDPFSPISTRLTFQTELLSWPLMTPILQAPALKPANELKDHEFQLVVLSSNALTYDHLTVLDAIYWRGDELLGDERTRSYYVTLSKPVNGKYSFPSSMLTMTSIAVLVWDDVSPDDLSIDQQTAIVDWIHWGGQLIISGPNSWSRLQDSFLSPYLPGTPGDAMDLTSESFAALSDHWMVEDLNRKRKPAPIKILSDKPLAGVDIQLGANGQWIPNTGEMVAESQVGRGRVVVTKFPMNNPAIFRWPYYSSFFSTGLLRRHPRVMRLSSEDRVLAQYWATPYESSQHDARLHSNVRILTRDLPLSSSKNSQLQNEEEDGVGGAEYSPVKQGEINAPELREFDSRNPKYASTRVSEAIQWGGRAAAWNDYSGLSNQALETLRAAAGIELPSRKTILYLLGGYLLCLVPLNWLFFKILGRLEYAWIAAPIMALIGVVVVTRVARLDIGFARRTTEIAVLELQSDYPRAHLTQYIALYTSLSDDYTVDFPENDSVALPLGNFSRSTKRAAAETRELRTNYGRSEGVSLEGLTVYSNSTEMIHAEQLVELEGGLNLGRRGSSGDAVTGQEALKNDTGLNLRSVMLLRRNDNDVIERAWIGDLNASQVATLSFETATLESLWTEWESDPITQNEAPDLGVDESAETDALWIGGVLREMVRKTPLMPGHTRLFAYTNDRTSQLTVNPSSDQYDGRCLVVAHLTPARLGPIVPDLNIQSRGNGSLDEEELDRQLKDVRQNGKDANSEAEADEASTNDASADKETITKDSDGQDSGTGDVGPDDAANEESSNEDAVKEKDSESNATADEANDVDANGKATSNDASEST